MSTNNEDLPAITDNKAEIEALLRRALEENQPPPKEFVAVVMQGQIVLPKDVMEAFVDRGWLPRQRCEVWSRVMGYYRPVSQWNVGKRAEHAERVQLDPKKICD